MRKEGPSESWPRPRLNSPACASPLSWLLARSREEPVRWRWSRTPRTHVGEGGQEPHLLQLLPEPRLQPLGAFLLTRPPGSPLSHTSAPGRVIRMALIFWPL